MAHEYTYIPCASRVSLGAAYEYTYIPGQCSPMSGGEDTARYLHVLVGHPVPWENGSVPVGTLWYWLQVCLSPVGAVYVKRRV